MVHCCGFSNKVSLSLRCGAKWLHTYLVYKCVLMCDCEFSSPYNKECSSLLSVVSTDNRHADRWCEASWAEIILFS